jgi:DNA (cytosine-5)-methyltransferase 1
MIKTNCGLFVPSHAARKPRPIAFDFFCGAGGFGLGVLQAGFEIVGANEFDAAAAMTYMVNLGHYPMNIHYIGGDEDRRRLDGFIAKQWGLSRKDYTYEKGIMPGDGIKPLGRCAGSGHIRHTDLPGVRNFWFGDIRKLRGEDILKTLGLERGDIDMVFGGPPCQGFSKAGKQEITDPRNNLVYEYARMIVELQPKTFVMEEVPDIVNFYDPDGVPVLDKFALMLQEGGYGKWEMIKKTLLTQAGSAGVIKDNMRQTIKSKSRKTAAKQALLFDGEYEEGR